MPGEIQFELEHEQGIHLINLQYAEDINADIDLGQRPWDQRRGWIVFQVGVVDLNHFAVDFVGFVATIDSAVTSSKEIWQLT